MTATLGFFVLISVLVAWWWRSAASGRTSQLGWGSGSYPAASRQFDNNWGGPVAAASSFDGGCSFGDGGGSCG